MREEMVNERVEALARRVQEDPDFLAFALAIYARSEGINEVALAQRLGCDLGQMGPLQLCLRPKTDGASFLEDIDRIASSFGIDGDILTDVIRRADALVAMRQTVDDAGFLMAARDRKDENLSLNDVPLETP